MATKKQDAPRGTRRAGAARKANEARANGAKAAAPPNDAKTRKALLHSMLLQRRFEEKAAEAYALGKIGGFCHLYIGQEAVGTGVISLLRDDDYIITSYRDHGQALARGLTARSVMAELFGRSDGCSKGKGGSMHLFDREKNFLGGHGIVGGHLPIGTGVAFAIKYRGGDQVCICFFGEAAVNNGAFHEALNMAALWRLPIIYIIENNRYGMGTALERASAINDIAERACSYDMPNEVVDGQDIVAVREATARAIERARSDSEPTLLEMRTYRFMGHSMSDAVSGTYRTKEELEEHMKRDPIAVLRAVMEEEDGWTDEQMTAMDQEVRQIVDDSYEFAEESPEPPAEALYEDVLVDTTS
jgi:pyruvate dehydrogenase E1 component alpha subunit